MLTESPEELLIRYRNCPKGRHDLLRELSKDTWIPLYRKIIRNKPLTRKVSKWSRVFTLLDWKEVEVELNDWKILYEWIELPPRQLYRYTVNSKRIMAAVKWIKCIKILEADSWGRYIEHKLRIYKWVEYAC